MLRVVACLGALIGLGATPARAEFHYAVIDEVMAGRAMDPTQQYVEIRIFNFGSQNFVKATRLAAFNCAGNFSAVLLEVPANVCNGEVGARWTMATPSFASATGVNPDFLWDPAATGMLDTSCGTVCWGAPGTSAEEPPHGRPPTPATTRAASPTAVPPRPRGRWRTRPRSRRVTAMPRASIAPP